MMQYGLVYSYCYDYLYLVKKYPHIYCILDISHICGGIAWQPDEYYTVSPTC